MTTEILKTLARFPTLNIVVAGDLMLDHYITGSTDRTSPEAPVPVVLVREETYCAGGAANVARNLAAAGANVRCIGAIGSDKAGQQLKTLLNESHIETRNLLTTPHYHTTVKTRVVSQGQQIVRLDHEQPWPANTTCTKELCARAETALADAHALILSDYGKGLLTDTVIKHLLKVCSQRKIPAIVDPKGRDYTRYQGATAITPNSREAREATGITIDTHEGLAAAAATIRQSVQCNTVVITCGADGLAVMDETENLTTVPTSAREVYDVTGAGDTFVAWFTLALASGQSPKHAARLANLAAGISVGRPGPAVVSRIDIQQGLASDRLARKLIQPDDLPSLREQLKTEGKHVVLTNGCFDFLHAGHVAFLQHARALGDVLVLAINTDESVRRLKGEPRPIITQAQRAELLASIDAVDYLTIFAADTPHQVITALQPQVLAKGSNYNLNQIEGADLVKSYGGKVTAIPIIHDFHTSKFFAPE